MYGIYISADIYINIWLCVYVQVRYCFGREYIWNFACVKLCKEMFKIGNACSRINRLVFLLFTLLLDQRTLMVRV